VSIFETHGVLPHMTRTLVLGLDEAGRGPGIGPMVLAAVALDEVSEALLAQAGVRDSKVFGSSSAGRQARARLATLIREHAPFVSVEICDVADIDAYVARSALNLLERERASLLIRRAPACTRIIADGRTLFGPLSTEFPSLEAVDRAESAHTAVAAASICAKALRDELFEAIASRYEPTFGALRGGGYVNPATVAFISEYVRRHGQLPPEARKSWPWRGVNGLGNDNSPTTALPAPPVR
jgi:ribonuclease HII